MNQTFEGAHFADLVVDGEVRSLIPVATLSTLDDAHVLNYAAIHTGPSGRGHSTCRTLSADRALMAISRWTLDAIGA